jgi:hypothetical protein
MPDISHQEQISVIVEIVSIPQAELKVKEHYL